MRSSIEKENPRRLSGSARALIEQARYRRLIASVASAEALSSGRRMEQIDSIAQTATRTNLLALNAAIATARKSEDGRGLRSAAARMQDLSAATGRATDEIARRIAALESVSPADRAEDAETAARALARMAARVDAKAGTLLAKLRLARG